MKTYVSILSVLAGGLLLSGCIYTEPPPPSPPGPAVVTSEAPAAPPSVENESYIPDDYTWDGYEYVGLVGDQYYYLGPGNVWIICDPVRLGRFHGWEHDHQDWRSHVTVNVRFRNDGHGHFHPQGERHGGHSGHDDWRH